MWLHKLAFKLKCCSVPTVTHEGGNTVQNQCDISAHHLQKAVVLRGQCKMNDIRIYQFTTSKTTTRKVPAKFLSFGAVKVKYCRIMLKS